METTDKLIGELFRSGMALYVLSIFISMFDARIGSFLKKVAYLNAFSFIFLIFIQLWVLFIRFTDCLEKIGNWKVLKLLQ